MKLYSKLLEPKGPSLGRFSTEITDFRLIQIPKKIEKGGSLEFFNL
jgi:hypothetical protein